MGSAGKLVSGIGWGGLSMAVVAISQLVFLALLARLLTPADFGLVALANISLRFLSYFAQLGVSPALIQKPTLEPEDIAAALSVSLAISTLCAALAAAGAPLAALLFDMPSLAGPTAAMALIFPIQGFAAVSTGLLNREMRFRTLGIVDALAYVLGYGTVGVALAMAGWGVWSLVGAALAQGVVQAGLAYAASRHPIKLQHRPDTRRHFLAYGGRHSLTGFIEFLSNNIDIMAVGKMLGDNAAGMYNRTTTLANLPAYHPTRMITRALFPVLSSAGRDQLRQAIGLQLGLMTVGVYAFSTAAAISTAAEPLVKTLLGAAWIEAIPVLQVFALSVGPRFVTEVVGVSLDAMGALRSKLWVQGSCLVLMAAAVAAALPYGLIAVATAVLVVEVVRLSLFLGVAAQQLQNAPMQWSLTLPLPALAGLCSAGAVHLGLQCLPEAPQWLGVLAACCAACLATAIAVLLYRPWLFRIVAVGWAVGRIPRLARSFPKAVPP